MFEETQKEYKGVPPNHSFYELLKFFPASKAGKTNLEFPPDETAHNVFQSLHALPNVDIPVYYDALTMDNVAIVLNGEIAVVYNSRLKRISSILAVGKPVLKFGSGKHGISMIRLSRVPHPIYYQFDKLILELTTVWLVIHWQSNKVERIVCYTKETQCQLIS